MIELLVVIAIITILAALFLGPGGQVKVKAKRVQCMSQLHQLGIGLQIVLANDHGYPLFLENTNGSWIDQLAGEGLGMSQPLTNFIRTGVWRCPAAYWVNADTNYLPISYGYNVGGVVSDENADNNFGLGGKPSNHTPVKDSEVICPVEMMAIGDVFHSRLAMVRNPDYGVTQFAYQRHYGVLNVAFCDGHVESPKLKFLFVETNDAVLSRWNRDHQPHLEMIR